MKVVEGKPGLVRDGRGVIHNINTPEVEQARARKRTQQLKEQEFEDLKTEVSEMKGMLTQILEKL